MEQIIARLVNDFESGKITRRKLIQSLAITAAATATTSSLGLAQATEAPAKRPLTPVAFNHISYLTEDYKKTADWYQELFTTQRYHETGTSCDLAFGPALGPYMVFRDINSVKDRQKNVSTYIDHVAYLIDDWNANSVEAELKRRGLDSRPSGNPPASFYVEDPNGIGVQITSGRDINRVTMKP
jgi:catechol-2,3-dioxygenase